MNKYTICIFALSAAVVAASVGMPDADTQRAPRGKGVALASAPVTVSGVHTGSLTGEVTINGQSIFITRKTSFYRVGTGPVPPGQSVLDTGVFVSGRMAGGRLVATMIIIGEPLSSKDFSMETIAEAGSNVPDPKVGN